MTIPAQIDAHLHRLTPAERRVAVVVADEPEAVAFGTVADVARRAGASGATVVRLATKLGFGGFVELQASVREELARRLRPASERIRHPAAGDVLGTTLAVEMANVAASLDGVDRVAFEEAVRLLSGAAGSGRPRSSRVFVLSGDASSGVAALFAAELSMLRPGITLADGSEVRVARLLADVAPHDVVVVIDLARYDRAVIDAARRAAEGGAVLVVLTDSALSPFASLASVNFTASVSGAGPFDSHVGLLSLANALLAGVAAGLRSSATDRLDQVEAAWGTAAVLVDS
jgi:DNA-binding MurR/RpiR family transcriptional regulator